MKEDPRRPQSAQSIFINAKACNGCIICLRACPTKAIRVKAGLAYILPELCVDCGECIRVCPREAVVPLVSTYREVMPFKVKAVVPSPAIFSQFGDEVSPNEILLAFTKLGFDFAYDIGRYCEMVSLVQMDWIRTHPEIRPVISFTCPVVVRLVAKRFPSLIPNLIRVEPPREVAAKHVRQLLRRKTGLIDDYIGVFHITPCAAKVSAINKPMALRHSYLSGALGINDIYGDILLSLKEITDADQDKVLFRSSGLGLSWDSAGGETAGLRLIENKLNVAGLAETIEVLEQIEAGQLQDVTFIEGRTCPDGCLGGPLTVENRYRARATVTKLVQMYGTLPRVRGADVDRLGRAEFFAPEKEVKPILYPYDKDPLKALAKLKRVDELTALLPGKLCGVCGAPDCRTLAEDVVLGKADLTACPFLDKSLLSCHPEEKT
jgi:Na+-translocating ferredoxin:NAD+ oxidoreductase RNF subunit RnfB